MTDDDDDDATAAISHRITPGILLIVLLLRVTTRNIPIRRQTPRVGIIGVDGKFDLPFKYLQSLQPW